MRWTKENKKLIIFFLKCVIIGYSIAAIIIFISILFFIFY